MPFTKISLQPELFSPPRFRIQGGYPVRYGPNKVQTNGNLVSNIGWSNKSKHEWSFELLSWSV